LLLTYGIAQANAGRPDRAAEVLWPLASRGGSWSVRWTQAALELLDAKEGQAWLDRLAQADVAKEVAVRVALAEAYDRMGQRQKDDELTSKAAALYAKITMDPKAPVVALLSGAAGAERANNRAGAEALYRRVVSADPKAWVAYNNLAMLIVQRGGDAAEALGYAATAVRLAPRLAAVRDTLAQVQSRTGDAMAAAESARGAIRLEPDNALWHIHLAQYLLDAGKRAEAAKAIAVLDSRRLDNASMPSQWQQDLKRIRQEISGNSAG
jgi:tetratricopeptide (TPR) repeat protein